MPATSRPDLVWNDLRPTRAWVLQSMEYASELEQYSIDPR
jgi:hypothetical protein